MVLLIFLLMLCSLCSVAAVGISVDCSATATDTIDTPVVDKTIFKADIALLIDESDSIQAPDYKKEIDFCQKLVRSFNVNDDETRFALIWFSGGARMGLDWYKGNNAKRVTDVLSSTARKGGGTNFTPPLAMVYEWVLRDKTHAKYRSDARKIVILITDGVNGDDPTNVSRQLRDAGVIIFVIRVLNNAGVNQTVLTQITGDAGRVLIIDNFDSLKTELDKLKTDIMKLDVCGFHYQPTCQCYYNDSKACVQDGILNIIQSPETIQGKSRCPTNNATLSCNASRCEVFCATWEWAPWGDCWPQRGIEGQRNRFRNSIVLEHPRLKNCNHSDAQSCDWIVQCLAWEWSSWGDCWPVNGAQGEQRRQRNSTAPENSPLKHCNYTDVRSCDWLVQCLAWEWSAWSDCQWTNGSIGEQRRWRSSIPEKPVLLHCDYAQVNQCDWTAQLQRMRRMVNQYPPCYTRKSYAWAVELSVYVFSAALIAFSFLTIGLNEARKHGWGRR